MHALLVDVHHHGLLPLVAGDRSSLRPQARSLKVLLLLSVRWLLSGSQSSKDTTIRHEPRVATMKSLEGDGMALTELLNDVQSEQQAEEKEEKENLLVDKDTLNDVKERRLRVCKSLTSGNVSDLAVCTSRGECGRLSRMLGSMTKLFGQRLARSTDLLFLKTLTAGVENRESKAGNDVDTDLARAASGSYASYPVTHDSLRLIEQTKTICEQRIYLDEAKELFSLLSSKWMQAVLEIHDELAAQIQNNTEEVEYIDGVSSLADTDDLCDSVKSRLSLIHEDREGEARAQEDEEVQVDTFRVVGVRRKPGECLGLTVRVERGRPVVARILIDSAIDRQGLVTPGDVILQANGKEVRNPEELQKAIEESGEFLVFKIRPSVLDLDNEKKLVKQRVFLRALFDYSPNEDKLLPCQEIGLHFRHGDIVEILNWSDPSWWQARKVDSRSRAGLIPSQDLEERRQCFVKPDNGPIPTHSNASCCGPLSRREKRRLGYHLRKNVDFDAAELLLYEPVEKMPPFSRKTLVLITPGQWSLERREMIKALVHEQPDTFGTVLPYTDRPRSEGEKEGEEFRFVSRDRMIQGLDNGEFLDVRERDGFLIGTTFESVRAIMNESKLCLLDIRPEALKLLHNSTEFLPYVIYLGPGVETGELKVRHENGTTNGTTNGIQSYELVFSESRHVVEESHQIRKEFQKYFDLECPFDSLESTLANIRLALNKLMSETQWVE